MVEAAGIEPETCANPPSTKTGRDERSHGHDTTQPGQGQEVRDERAVESRSARGLAAADPGRETSITGAQLSAGTSEAAADPDLGLVLNAWGELPKRARHLVAKLVATLRGSASTDGA
jgi:hypothetical protein